MQSSSERVWVDDGWDVVDSSCKGFSSRLVPDFPVFTFFSHLHSRQPAPKSSTTMTEEDFLAGLDNFLPYLKGKGSMPSAHIDGKTFHDNMIKTLNTTVTGISKGDTWKEVSSGRLLEWFWRNFDSEIFTVQVEAGKDVYGICTWWFNKIRVECMTDRPTNVTFEKVQKKLAETLHSQDEKAIEVWCDEFFKAMCHHLTNLQFKQRSGTPMTEISPKTDNVSEGQIGLYTSDDWVAAWKHPYKGDALSHLEQKLRLNIESMRNNIQNRIGMSRIIPIVQSSGTGKSRLAEEFNPLHCIANCV
jgi:hypothetical protein